jgi:hypothetical protein
MIACLAFVKYTHRIRQTVLFTRWHGDQYVLRFHNDVFIECLKAGGSEEVLYEGYNYVVSNPITGLDRPLGLHEVEAPRFLDNQHMKMVRLSALLTGRLYPPKKDCWYSFLLEADSTETIMSMKNSSDTIGNRTHDVPACSAVPQPTAPPLAPI